jgi:multicomponent Na+:H+ antiporter subunit B
MSSLILQTATRFLLPLLGLFSVFLLIEGHDKSGGGFVGGLVAAAAVVLSALAYGAATARKVLLIPAHQLLGVGLLTAASSGVWGLLRGKPFLTASWGTIDLPGAMRIELGTPLLFDLGVYLTVVGAVLTVLLALAEEAAGP